MPRSPHSEDSRRPSETARQTALEFQRGDAEAVARVRAYARRILGYRGLGIPPDDLPDLEQQVMTEVWRAATRPGFDPAAGFWGFVETVTARRCIDARRRTRPTIELSDSLADGGRGPLEAVLVGERARRARQVLGRLRAPCRELIELHAVRRLTYREIAPILGKSESALRVRMHRCIEAARRMIEDSGGPPVEAVDAEGGGA